MRGGAAFFLFFVFGERFYFQEYEIRCLRFEFSILKFDVWYLRFEIWDLISWKIKIWTWDLKFEVEKIEVWCLKFEISLFEIRNLAFESWKLIHDIWYLRYAWARFFISVPIRDRPRLCVDACACYDRGAPLFSYYYPSFWELKTSSRKKWFGQKFNNLTSTGWKNHHGLKYTTRIMPQEKMTFFPDDYGSSSPVIQKKFQTKRGIP